MGRVKMVGAIYADASALNLVADVLKGSPAEADQVIRRVLFRVRDNARAEIVRTIPRVFAVPRHMVSTAISEKRKRFVRLGYSGGGTVSIEVIGAPINLARFPHNPSAPIYGGARLKVKSSVQIIKGGGMKPISGRMGKHFYGGTRKKVRGSPMNMKNVFLMPTTKGDGGPKIPYFLARRNGRPSKRNPKREGIKPLATISIPQMLMNPKVARPVLDYVEQQLAKRVEVELANMVVGMQSGVKR